MKKSRLLATFVVAVLLAGTASYLVFQKLRQSAIRASASTYRVVLASRDLDIGTKLSEADLKVVDWAAGSVPSGAFTKASDPVGRAVLYPIYNNEVMLEAKLAAVGAGAGLPAVITPGMRAVSIRVDDVVAVAGFVGPGTRVDVLLTGNPGASPGPGSESLTKTILENVLVLAAGQKIQPDGQGRAEKVNVVTLLCNPQDAAKVTLAANEGHIQLVLRNPTDVAKGDKEPEVGRQALYGRLAAKPAAAPAPAPRRAKKPALPEPQVAVVVPPPPPPPPAVTLIEIVRGERVSKVEVSNPATQGEAK